MDDAVDAKIKQLENVITHLMNYKYRIKDKDNSPGGLIELPDDVLPIIVGDLHSNKEYLKLIMEDDGNLERLRSKDKEYVLVIIGDAIHNDQTGMMMEQPSSMYILDYIFDIISEFPDRVIYIKGNHDTFDPQLRKSGIAQGMEFKNFLIKTRGEDYTAKIGDFFDCLPFFIKGSNYVITHAGPVRGGITRDELININHDADKAFQLQWNRVHEFRGNPSKREYSEEDIKETLRKLDMPADSDFIVGHNPLWNTGDKTGVWENVIGIKNHHIIYSGTGSLAPYYIREGGKFNLKFALKERKSGGFDYDR